MPTSSPTRTKRKREPEEIDLKDLSADEEEQIVSAKEEEDEKPEVEVLSHAAQRKRRKQLAAASATGEDVPSVNSSAQSTRQATDSLAKRQHSVWVGNLSFKTDPKALRQFFSEVGENCVTRVHMPMKLPSGPQDGKPGAKARLDNRGFAYVDFASNDLKLIAITMSERELDGRKLLIKDGGDFAGRPAVPTIEGGTATVTSSTSTMHSKTAQKILASQKHPASPTLFLGNLGFEATDDSIRTMFDAHAAYGPAKKAIKDESETADGELKKSKSLAGIRKVRMGTFEDSGLCKGFAFVDFDAVEQATAALTNTRNHSMDGRKLVVQYAGADAVRRGGGPGSQPRGQRDNTTGEPYKKRQRIEDDGEGKDESKTQPQGTGKRRPGKSERLAAKQAAMGTTSTENTEGTKERKERKSSTTTRRVNSGAALANAQRGSAAIVASMGQKVVFD